jgi:hypothetical protein
MNLKPAEEWMNEGYLLDPKMTAESRQQDKIRFIRQIQADALRYAAHLVDSWGHSDSAYNLQERANQLDPRPESNQ